MNTEKIDLRAMPFFLNEEEIAWVNTTLSEMTDEEKIGQLFCPIGYSTDAAYLDSLLKFNIGGLFFRDGKSTEMRETFKYAQIHSKIPLLIPSNLESGGNGAASDGTFLGRQMEIAATGKKENAYLLGKVSALEGATLGINWAFAPVVDVDLNFRNPITNVRTYGDDASKVIEFASEYLKGAKECGLACAIKHFPGDGVDERDQHLLTSVNSLSMDEWDSIYGKIYSSLINEGVLSVMAGHIALPSYQNYFNPSCKGSIIPASLSEELLKKLLREKLGFNGLIISDATPMVGFTSAMERKKAVPLSIQNGCDMFLFNKDLSEDYNFMMEGYKSGILTEKRLNEACTRILAMKANLGLFRKKKEGNLVPEGSALACVGCEEHKILAQKIADQSITLVKDSAKTLPINAEKNRRILLEVLGSFESNSRVENTVKEELEKRGFEVTCYRREDFSVGVDNVSSFLSKYDTVIYVGNIENASNKTTNRIDWYTFWGQGNNVPWFANELPCIFASVGNPYNLFDVPMIKTYINGYSNSEYVLKALVKKITGEEGFYGISPIDPFCGREELRY